MCAHVHVSVCACMHVWVWVWVWVCACGCAHAVCMSTPTCTHIKQPSIYPSISLCLSMTLQNDSSFQMGDSLMLMMKTSQTSYQGPTRTHQEMCHTASYKHLCGMCGASILLRCVVLENVVLECVTLDNVLLKCVLWRAVFHINTWPSKTATLLFPAHFITYFGKIIEIGQQMIFMEEIVVLSMCWQGCVYMRECVGQGECA